MTQLFCVKWWPKRRQKKCKLQNTVILKKKRPGFFKNLTLKHVQISAIDSLLRWSHNLFGPPGHTFCCSLSVYNAITNITVRCCSVYFRTYYKSKRFCFPQHYWSHITSKYSVISAVQTIFPKQFISIFTIYIAHSILRDMNNKC